MRAAGVRSQKLEWSSGRAQTILLIGAACITVAHCPQRRGVAGAAGSTVVLAVESGAPVWKGTCGPLLAVASATVRHCLPDIVAQTTFLSF